MHHLYLMVLDILNMAVSKSIANQESRVLMLSENARGDANPILLIDEDDVEEDTQRLLAELTLSNFTT